MLPRSEGWCSRGSCVSHCHADTSGMESSIQVAGLAPHHHSGPPFCLANVHLSSRRFSVSTSTSSSRPYCLASKM